MAFPETHPARGQNITDTVRIAWGSLDSRFVHDTPSNRAAFQANVTSETVPSPNSEIALLHDTMEVVEKWRLPDLSIDYSKPYWNPKEQYGRLEVLNTLSQYLDFHKLSLPITILPPQEDIKKFMDKVLSSEKKLSATEQLDIALRVTDEATGTPNVVGAANIAFIGTRLAARGLDQRAYPRIPIGPDELRNWNDHVAQFPDEPSGRYDGPGDTYYYWSHLFGAAALEAVGGKRAKAIQGVLGKGTSLMRFVRTHVAKRPTETPHEEASILGRQIGLALAEEVGLNQRPIFSSAK